MSTTPAQPLSSARLNPADLPKEVQGALIERLARSLAAEGVTRVAIYPAGRHTRRHGLGPYRAAGLEPVACVDDLATGEVEGVGIVTPERLPEGVGAVVISADLREEEFAERARAWAERAGARVVRLYGALGGGGASRRWPSDEIGRLRRGFNGLLNLGCGPHPLEGWTNVDGGDDEWYGPSPDERVIALDAFRAMAALPDGSCEAIYSEHFYEHFTLEAGHDMAREWARLLRPGGVVRVVTPDLARVAKDILGIEPLADPAVVENHRRTWLGTRHRSEVSRFLTPAMLANFGMRLDGHKFIYDEETLKRQLEHAGLTGARRCGFGESPVAALAGIDRHDGGATGGRWLKEGQLVVEAVKPG